MNPSTTTHHQPPNTHNIYKFFFQKNQKSTVVYALNDLHRHKKNIIADTIQQEDGT